MLIDDKFIHFDKSAEVKLAREKALELIIDKFVQLDKSTEVNEEQS